jgi:uncharacterized membrane protein YwzB
MHMNYNLIAVMIFVVFLIVLYWIIPSKKGEKITKNITSLFQVLPISKIVEGFVILKDNKKVPPKQD